MRNYFDFRFKYGLLNKFSDVWNIKSGDFFDIKYKNAKKCYRAHKFFSGIYNYIYVGLMPLALLLLWLFLMKNGMLVSSVLTIIIYFIFEIALVAFVPMVKIDCLEKRIEDKKRLERKW